MPRQWRWWSGGAWTEHVAPRTVSVALRRDDAAAFSSAGTESPASTAPRNGRRSAALGLALALAPALLFGLLGAISAVHLPAQRNALR